jgi:uncharacterized membrane protein
MSPERKQSERTEPSPAARGGVSIGSVLTGVVVAFGAGFLLSALLAGILAALGAQDPNITRGDLLTGGIAAGVALVVATFLAYLWGGYVAGRMARGAGILNGALVPIVALVIGAIVGAVVFALGSQLNAQGVNLPFNLSAVTQTNKAQTWGLGLSIATLVAMFAGGILGGALGERWHHKLESAEVSRS